jgi:tetratricopeptide (TPR) repeat protein
MANALSGSRTFSRGIKCLAWCVVLLQAAVSILNLWPQTALEFLPLRPAGPAGRLTLPQAHSYLGWDSYQKRNYEDARGWMRLFNAWQPTQDSLLLEGKCDLELGRREAARALYKQVIAFDPRSRQARLALIDLDLKEMDDPNGRMDDTIEEILNWVPWDDAPSIVKISGRLLALAENRPGAPRLLLTATVLYLDPSDPVLLRMAGVLLLQEPEPEIRRIGAGLVIATLLAERGRLSEKDIRRLDAFLPGNLTGPEKNALLAGRFSRVSAQTMIARQPPPDDRLDASIGTDVYPICLEREWHRHLGWLVRHGNEHP